MHSAVEAKETKTPAEASLLTSVQSVRELLDLKRLRALHWIDTRDMLADGLTKGAVPRDAIIQLLEHCSWKQVGDNPYSLWAFVSATTALTEGSHEDTHCETFPDARTVYYKRTSVAHLSQPFYEWTDPTKGLYSSLAGPEGSSGLGALGWRRGVG